MRHLDIGLPWRSTTTTHLAGLRQHTGRRSISSTPADASATPLGEASTSDPSRRFSGSSPTRQERPNSADGPSGAGRASHDGAPVAATGFERPADWQTLRSPEIYLGHDRGEGLASPGGAALGRRRAYRVPARLDLNRWAIDGDWTLDRQPAVLDSAPGRIVCRFHARDVHLVMGRRAARLSALSGLDRRPAPGRPSGGRRRRWRRHCRRAAALPVIRQPGPIVDRTFEIAFLDAGVAAFRVHIRFDGRLHTHGGRQTCLATRTLAGGVSWRQPQRC